MSRRSCIWRHLFVIACLLVLALEVLPGRMAYIDEVFFKAAGRHWAATGSFAAPEIAGRISVQPGLESIYFAQPPLYTFIFGVYTRLVGFGPHRCILFDALIHLLLAALTVLLARKIFQAPASYACAAGIVVLFLGTRGRPDELAMCLAIGGILCWTLELNPKWRALLCGAAFGLCGATSLGVCFLIVPLALLVAHHRGALSWRTASRAVLCGAFVASLCVAPILARHPLAYRQLVAHAAVQSPQMQELLAGGDGEPRAATPAHRALWKNVLHSEEQGSLNAVRFAPGIIAVSMGTLLLIILCLPAMPAEGSRQWRQSAAVAACGMAVLWLMMPGKYTYLWFFGPWLLSLASVVLAHSFSSMRRLARAAVVLLCASVLVVVAGLYAKERLIMLALPRDQAFYRNMDHVRELIPAGAHVGTQEYWWALADKCQVVDPIFSHPTPLELDYLIKTGNGSGAPGKPALVSEYFEAFARDHHFVVLEDDLNRAPLKIAGMRLTHSAWGFGPYILARSPERLQGARAH